MRTSGPVPSSDQQAGPNTHRERLWPWRACAVLAAVLLFVGNLEAWAYPGIADTSQFVATTRDVLEREDVREALATRIVDSLLQANAALHAAIGETLTAMVTGLLGSETFQAVYASLASQLQMALVHGEEIAVTIESRELQVVVLAVAEILSPEETDNLALEGGVLRIEIFSDADIPSFESEITILRWAGIAAAIIGLFLIALPYFIRRDRWSVRLAGLALVGVSLATFLVVLLVSWLLDLYVSDRQVHTVIAGIVDEFTGRLIAQTFVVLLIGVGLCAHGMSRWPSRRQATPQPA